VRTALVVAMACASTAFLPVLFSPLRTMRTLPTAPEPAGAAVR
jgi:hypothetical protein